MSAEWGAGAHDGWWGRCADALRRAMGCCSSICGKSPDRQEENINERTHLLVDPVRNEPAPSKPARAAQTPRKSDEQSALSRILQETATNVIDVGALGTHALEPHEYNERVKLYQTRLTSSGGIGVLPGSNASKTTLPQPLLLRDVSNAEKAAILAQEPIAPQDKLLIGNILKTAVGAMSKIKVEHREDLVVPFRIP